MEASGTDRWTVNRVRTVAGLTEGVSRSIYRDGLMPDGDPTLLDVPLLKVAANLQTSPLPMDGQTRVKHEATIRDRNTFAMLAARQETRRDPPNPGCMLVVFPLHAHVVDSGYTALELAAKHPTEATLILPLGQWIADVTGSAGHRGDDT